MDPFDWLVEPTSEFIETQNKVRSEEEIKKFALDEKMTDTQKYNYLINKGFPIQKLSVILNLPRLIKERPESFNDIFVAISRNLPSWEIDIQRQAADTFKEMLNAGQLDPTKHCPDVVRLTVKMFKQPRPEIIEKWSELFSELIGHINHSDLGAECLDLVLELSSVDQENESLRDIAVNVMGSLCRRYVHTNNLPAVVLDRFNLLLQDHSWAIRRNMCQYISVVCQALGPSRTSGEMIPEIIELFRDDMEEVKISIFETTINLFPFLSDDDLKDRIIPEYLSFLRVITDKNAVPIAKAIGELIYVIHDRLEDSSLLNRCIEIFCTLPQRMDAEERRLCAYNIPGVAYCLKEKYFHSHLKKVLESLAKDEVIEVQRTLALGIHEVFKVYTGTEIPEFLKDTLNDLADSEDVKVSEGLSSNFADIIFSFVSERHEDSLCLRESQKPVLDFTEFVTNMVPRLKSNWRLHQKFLENLLEIIKYFSVEDIRTCFAKLMMTAMHDGTNPVKTTASNVLANVLNFIQFEEMRNSLLDEIVGEFALSSRASDRAMFMEFSIQATETLSRESYKRKLLNPTLKLQGEKIPNLRYKFCRCLQAIRKKYLDLDFDLDQKIHDLLSEFSSDPDTDVREFAEDVQFSFTDSFSSGGQNEASDLEEKLHEQEVFLKNAEDKEREEQKKRELELLANQARQEYLLNLANNQKSPRGNGNVAFGSLGRGKTMGGIPKKRYSEVISRGPQGFGAARSPSFSSKSRTEHSTPTIGGDSSDHGRSPLLTRKSLGGPLKAAGKSIGGTSSNLTNTSPRLKKKKTGSPVTILATSKRESLLLSAAGVESMKKSHSSDERVISRMKALKKKQSK